MMNGGIHSIRMGAFSQKTIGLALLLICFFPGFVSKAQSETSLLFVDADGQLQYAEQCMSAERYQQAVDEYRRFIFFFPRDDRIPEVTYRIAEAHFKAGSFTKAIKAIRELTDRYSPNESEWAVEGTFLMAQALLRLNRSDEALVVLHNLILVCDDPEIRDRARHQMGWIHVKSAQWLKARDAFESISADGRLRYRIEALNRAVDGHADIAHKNPVLAGFLSVLPGAGQLYCQRPKDALIAFGVNALFILAAWEAFSNELYAIGSMLTMAELGFYSGNIYNAVSSAHKYNRDRTQDFIRRLERQYISGIALNPAVGPKGLMLTVRIPF
jgi:tetratricopeptide (TPR) repeat protein